MAKLRINNRYGIAPNTLLYSEFLSLKAKGLFVYMQSKPDDWNFSAERIAKENKEGKDAVQCALKELEDAGYLRREKYKNEKGRWEWVHVLSETPEREKPEPENPATENPATENPATKQTVYSKQDVVKSIYTTEQGSGESKQKNKDIADIIKAFENINPASKSFYKRDAERNACIELLNIANKDKIIKFVSEIYPQIRGEDFCPQIKKPTELLEKWTSIGNFMQRRNRKTNIVAFS